MRDVIILYLSSLGFDKLKVGRQNLPLLDPLNSMEGKSQPVPVGCPLEEIKSFCCYSLGLFVLMSFALLGQKPRSPTF